MERPAFRPRRAARTVVQVFHGRLILVIVLLAGVLIAGLPLARSQAVTGVPVTPALTLGQVRIFENGVLAGGGTLVGGNWAVTVGHLFDRPDNPSPYALRFGESNDENDLTDTAHLRPIDRIVFPPPSLGGGGVVMVHFRDPVPDGTPVSSLAEQVPPAYTRGIAMGWGPDGRVLRMGTGVVIDPVATANANALRTADPIFAADFPPPLQPMVTTVAGGPGDSGSGFFDPMGVLAGITWGGARYQDVNASGNLAGFRWTAAYALPIWPFRQWILDTINGVGSSGGNDSHDELKRRRLPEVASGNLPMTNPPQTGVCDSAANCPEPTWTVGTLTADSTSPGFTTAVCADVASNSCTFNGDLSATGEAGDQVKSGLQVEAWCQSTATLIPGDAPQTVVLVSFTNADPAQPDGFGWWDVDPDSVQTAAGPLNPATLSTCQNP